MPTPLERANSYLNERHAGCGIQSRDGKYFFSDANGNEVEVHEHIITRINSRDQEQTETQKARSALNRILSNL